MDDSSRRQLVDELTSSSGSPTTLVATGEPGIGRTTLLVRIAADLRAQGAWVGWATASEASMHRPWSVLASALDVAIEQPPTPDSYERILERVEHHATDRCAVVVVDDAHLADAESLAGLRRLAAAGQHLPVRLVLSRRSATTRERLDQLEAESWVRTTTVEPLDEATVRRLATLRLGREPDAAMWDRLAQLGGNPLRVQRVLDQAPGRAAGRSMTLTALVDEQLDRVDEAAADLVAVVAVWGAPIAPAELSALAGLSVAATMRTITRSIDGGALAWSSNGRIEPASPTHGLAAYERLAPGMRQYLHAACLDHLRRTAPDDPAIARHLRLAEADPTPELRAVAAALADAPGVAADVLAEAATASTDAEVIAAVTVERAAALARSGQMAAAAAAASSALAGELPDEARAALLVLLVLTYSARGLVADVDRLVAEVDRSGLPAATAMRLDLQRRSARIRTGDPAARAEAIASNPPDTVTVATGTLPLVTKSIALMLDGDGVGAVELAERVAAGYRQLSRQNVAELASVDIWPPRFRLYTFGRDDARQHLDQWRRLTADAGQHWVDAYHQGNSATLALYDGRLEDAAAEYDAAMEALAQDDRGWSSIYAGMRARIHLAVGEIDQAALRIAAFRRLGQPDTLGLAYVDLVEAEIAAATDDRESAARLATRSWRRAVDERNVLWMLLGGVDHLRLAEEAQRAEIVAVLGSLDTSRVPALRHVVGFAQAVGAGDVAAARAAAEHSREIASRYNAARMLGDVAELAALGGDTSMARQVLVDAVDQLDELGAVGDARALTARLRARDIRLGARGRRGRPKIGWGSLTPTEARIVTLVAEGATGPQIGRTLYISPRTVQTHVSHALGKLGLTTRLELVAAYAKEFSVS